MVQLDIQSATVAGIGLMLAAALIVVGGVFGYVTGSLTSIDFSDPASVAANNVTTGLLASGVFVGGIIITWLMFVYSPMLLAGIAVLLGVVALAAICWYAVLRRRTQRKA